MQQSSAPCSLTLPTKGKVMCDWASLWAGHSSELNLTAGFQRLPTETPRLFLNVKLPIQDFPAPSRPTPMRGARTDWIAKIAKAGPAAGLTELFLKLTAAVTHPSYSPLTSHSSHQPSYPSHSDSCEPTYFQICSINITFNPKPLSCTGC